MPIVEDVRNVEGIKEIVANATEQPKRKQKHEGNTEPTEGEARTLSSGRGTDARDRREKLQPPITLVTGGFPCQPFSVAGKRRGTADNRYLWNEMLAIIKIIKPTWVLAENVSGIAGMAFTDSIPSMESETPQEMEGELSAVLDVVCIDLEKVGYAVQPIVIPACAVNAPHRRDRVWIVAHNSNNGFARSPISIPKRQPKQKNFDISGESEDVGIPQSRQPWEQTKPKGREDSGRGGQEIIISNATTKRLQGQWAIDGLREGKREPEISRGSWWAVEPKLGRVAHGIPDRVDRIKCLGNAIVPQVAYQILRLIAGIEGCYSK